MTVLDNTRQNIITRFFKCNKVGEKLEFVDEEYTSVKCMGIYNAYLPDIGGSVYKGTRPVLVISNNKNNQYSPTVNVIPFTTKMDKRRLPIHVEFKEEYENIGLRQESTLACEQVITIPIQNIQQNIGYLRRKIDALKVVASLLTQFPILSIL